LAATQQDRSSAPTPIVNGRVRHARFWPLEFYRSAVGKKWVMAVTGIMLLGYVLAHMIGNLKLYLGAEDLDHYGEFLRMLLYPILPRTVTLWLLRLGLIAAFALHIHSAYSLTRMNHRARPEGYAGGRDYIAADFASRSMRWTGIIVGLYVIWHLADLTWGTANGDFVRGDPYNNLVHSFDRLPVAILYIVANVALAVHIYHGAWSLFQSLGWNNPRFNIWRRRFAQAFAVIILVGNVSFPVAVMAGAVDSDPGQRVKVCQERNELDTSKACREAAADVAKEARA
jgi:succinate dehydrogenase / fumarate reductase cytochrome b subunit